MRDFRDANAMAQTLREALKAKSIPITHSESLELVAKILGFHDWNVLSARIKSEHQPTVIEPAALPPITVGARLPILPLRDIVLFPKMITPLSVVREVSKRAVERAMALDRRVLAVKQRRAADDNPSLQGLYHVGVAAIVIEQTTFDDGIIRLMLKGLERASIVRLIDGQFLTAEVAPVEESRGQDAAAFDLSRTVLEEFQAHWTVELDFADRFPLVVAAVAALPVRSCLIDGEAIVSDKSGLAVFELRSFRHDHDAVLCAFDLLEVDGEDLHRLPIEVRKAGRRRRSFRYPTRSTQRRVQSCALPCLSCS